MSTRERIANAESRANSFQVLVAELFKALGYEDVEVENFDSPQSIAGPDIRFLHDGHRTAVEVRHYRYASRPTFDLFENALNAATKAKDAGRADKNMLVVSCPLGGSPLAGLLQHWPSVEVWDATRVLEEASGVDADLYERFLELFEVSEAPEEATSDRPRRPRVRLIEEPGAELAERLRAVRPGQASSREYEDACIASLRYLFELDLYGWHEQLDTEDGLHRRDLICRILPNAEIWQLMLSDLHSRYVVFEFKNYSDKISQKEVITTERYLYPSALRTVAIIISPHGCKASAQQVMDGAMREHGKLILSLTVDEVARWLVQKDQGNDPNVLLFERVDQFLMRLGR